MVVPVTMPVKVVITGIVPVVVTVHIVAVVASVEASIIGAVASVVRPVVGAGVTEIIIRNLAAAQEHQAQGRDREQKFLLRFHGWDGMALPGRRRGGLVLDHVIICL
jgi:hypothetical protein